MFRVIPNIINDLGYLLKGKSIIIAISERITCYGLTISQLW